MSSDLRVLMKWDPQAENLCILHKNNQKYCSKSEELLCNDCFFTSLVAWLLYIFYLYRFYSSGFFHISWYIMDLQDVYCLIDSFCVCLSLIIPKKLQMIQVCPLLENVCRFHLRGLPRFPFKHIWLALLSE